MRTSVQGYLEDKEEDVGETCSSELENLLRLPPIGCVDLMVTTKCNMRCDYCFVENRGAGKTMCAEVAKRAIEFIFNHSGERKSVEIVLFGGEPMLCYPLIRDVIVDVTEKKARAMNKAAIFSMTTNGTLLDESKLQFCREHKITFLISIDGVRETHDRHRRMTRGCSSFDLLMERVPMFKAFQPWLGARMTVHPDAAAEVASNIECLYSSGFNQIIVGPAFGPAWTQDSLEEYDRQLRRVAEFYKQRLAEKAPFRMTLFECDLETITGDVRHLWGCGAAGGRIAITPVGEIYGCAKLATVENGKGKWRLGTIRNGFSRVGTRLALLCPPDSSRKLCNACVFAVSCRGGCLATNYAERGNPFLPSLLDCRMTRLCAMLRKTLYEVEPWNKNVIVPCVSELVQ